MFLALSLRLGAFQALLDAGVLAPSTEVVRERTYTALDAEANPAWDLGRMFYDAWPYVELFSPRARMGA